LYDEGLNEVAYYKQKIKLQEEELNKIKEENEKIALDSREALEKIKVEE
jgi:hypothetical protein